MGLFDGLEDYKRNRFAMPQLRVHPDRRKHYYR